MMTKEEAAAAMNGKEYRDECSKELRAAMREAGLVAVFGASDDLTEFDGAIHDEAGAGDETGHVLTRTGLAVNKCDEGDRCPNYVAREPNVTARWDHNGHSWWIETYLPHAPFTIMEDGGTYCRGVVIAVADLPA